MDIKHKPFHVRVKMYGLKEPIMLTGSSMISVMQELLRTFAAMPNRYGPGTIEFDFQPLDQHLTQQQKDLRELIAGIDPSTIEMETPEEAISNPWQRSPMNHDSPNYDVLYKEYQNCSSPKHRELKTPHDLAVLRKHMEDKYSESPEWWDGVHRW